MPKRIDAPAGWSARGLVLRSRTDADRLFLRLLYGSFRAEEMAPVPWPEAVKAQFLDSQFELQNVHFDHFHADADFMVVEEAGFPIGRLYLDRKPDGWLIVDVGFLPHRRSAGLGAELLRHAHRRARQAGAPRVWLHVAPSNPRARQLYERLGFRLIEADAGPYLAMEWPVS
ncbi:GNAT family N-acetyltransferase [Caulobacter mirabilis]|uniref:GNAT family N-acetyltransferase n=1 Tax=Caulobacter mirabilis TaxID=69666 RepID=A0A2D2B1J1_9CAUL|nr:GNAT family N-acetyltransferase [Caulobacter mirabilis]ATQ44122.1 GNAT family N-acetyltransferase [Caulobacter mirabilis]